MKKYFIPSIRVRNCCSEYKEGQINKAYDNERKTINLLGVRKFESTKRADYELYMDFEWRKNKFGNSTTPKNWLSFAPIINWKDEEIWLYLLRENIEFNRLYKLGFHRVGCLICPFQQDYIDLLIEKHYPKRWNWWMNILKKNYEVINVKQNLKWTLKEWQNGKWKEATGKINEIITKSPTPERINEVANLLHISTDMAKKYFKKTCAECGKKMNPTELAMFYKLNGRYEDIENDNRPMYCKKCLCKQMNISGKEYFEKANLFKEQGCNLF